MSNVEFESLRELSRELSKLNCELYRNHSDLSVKNREMVWASKAGDFVKKHIESTLHNFYELCLEIEHYVNKVDEYSYECEHMMEKVEEAKNFVNENIEKVKKHFLSLPDCDTPEWICLKKIIEGFE